MSNNTLKVLSVYHTGLEPEDDAKVALSASTIKMVASRDTRVRDRDLKLITVHFIDGEVLSFNVSGLDLMTLEEVVAGYSDDF